MLTRYYWWYYFWILPEWLPFTYDTRKFLILQWHTFHNLPAGLWSPLLLGSRTSKGNVGFSFWMALIYP
jgi:hypothetical protein